MPIFVDTNDKRIFLEVRRSDTIDNVKVRIYEKNGIRPKQHQIMFEGRRLEGHLTVAAYDIEDGDTVDMFIYLCGC
jgi:ubiquitin C